jgi:aminoglycoside 3-N-acetyltransferase
MVTYRDLNAALRQLMLDRSKPVIAHASLSAFGTVQGGGATLLGAMLANVESLLMPTFTYKTMVIPQTGPPDNGLSYGSTPKKNRLAQFFLPDMPSDRLMGIVAETLRLHPQARRSNHPILSFAGINGDHPLEAQTLANPLGMIEQCLEAQGWVLLLGVDHTVNTSIHYGEKLAGRKQFTRWALTPQGVMECPGFPGCSHGFNAIAQHLESWTRRTQAGDALIQAIPLVKLVHTVEEWISEDPKALLCDQADCQRCSAVRAGGTTP